MSSDQQTGSTPVGSGLMQVNISSGAALNILGGGLQIDTLSGSGSVTSSTGLNNPALTVGANNGTSTFSGVISGALALTKSGAGIITLTGANSYTGSTSLSGGTLSFNAVANQTLSGVISGTGSLIQGGPGMLTLSGANTYTAPTTVNGGALVLSGAGNSNNGNIVMANGANLTFTDTSNSRTFSQAITGTAGTLTINAAGNTSATGGSDPTNFSLNNTGAFTGTVVINSGLVAPSADSAFGNTANVIQLNAANGASAGLVATANLTLPSTRSIQLTTAGGNGVFRAYGSTTFEIDGAISGPGNFFKTDGGTVLLAGAASNTYTGTTTVGAGTLILSKTGAVAVPGNLVIYGGANVWGTVNNQLNPNAILSNGNATQWACFTLLGGTQTIGGLNNPANNMMVANSTVSNGAASPNNSGAGSLVLAGSGNYTYGGDMWNAWGGGGTLALTMSGQGMQTLSGGNINYTGATNVNGGTLGLQDTTGFNSAINVGAGGALNLLRTCAGFGNRSNIAANTITGSGVINVNNAANSTGNTDGGWVRTSGLNFSGTINVNSGVFGTDGGAITGTATVNVASGAVFTNHSGSITIGALNGSGDVTPAQTGGGTYGFTVGNGGGSGTFTGIIHGNNSTSTDGAMEAGYIRLTKTGGGTEVLTGVNTYSAGTELLGGTLQVNVMSGVGTGYLGIKNGDFRYMGTGSETDTRTMWDDQSTGGTIEVVNSSAVLTLNPAGGNINNNLTKAGAARWRSAASGSAAAM